MRVFIAVRVKPNNQVTKLLSFLSKLEKVKVVEEKNLHINLKFLGEVDENQVEVIKGVLEKVGVSSFKVDVRGVGFFPSKEFIKVVFAKAEARALFELNAFIEEELYSRGFMKETRGYVPHVTLARLKRKLSSSEVEEIKKLGKLINFSFQAENVELIKSVLTKEKPLYKTIFKKQLSK